MTTLKTRLETAIRAVPDFPKPGILFRDRVAQGMRLLIHDDLLATGGTAAAAAELVRMQGGDVAGSCFLIELSFLNGVERLRPYNADVVRLVTY